MPKWNEQPHKSCHHMHHGKFDKMVCPNCSFKFDCGRPCCPRCGLSCDEFMEDEELFADFMEEEGEVHEPQGHPHVNCSTLEPIPGNGETYNAPPEPLIKPRYGEYIQPWNGYVPECTRKDQNLCKYFPAQTSNIKTMIYDGIEVKTNKWMNMACEEAVKSVVCGGGPFAGVIVQIDDETNQIIRYWISHNHVPQEKDPTAHAELSVVRNACRALGVVDLSRIRKADSRLPQPGPTSHCEIYSAAEPCPMCYSAIYWARIPAVYFAATRYDAAQQGVDFSDQPLYDDICKPYKERRIKVYQCTTDNSLDAFNRWKRSEKMPY